MNPDQTTYATPDQQSSTMPPSVTPTMERAAFVRGSVLPRAHNATHPTATDDTASHGTSMVFKNGQDAMARTASTPLRVL